MNNESERTAFDSEIGSVIADAATRGIAWMSFKAGIAYARAASANETAEACKTCGGSRVVEDGEITGSGGIEFENGPIKCVKDCPDCAAPTSDKGGA